MLTTTKNN